MTRRGAHIAANVMLASAGMVAAYVVITTPPLRRLAVRAARIWLGASVPVFLATEIRRAWVESGRAALT
jgi:hypothetical protein